MESAARRPLRYLAAVTVALVALALVSGWGIYVVALCLLLVLAGAVVGGSARFGQFTARSRAVIDQARAEARAQRAPDVGPAHLLLAMLHAKPGVGVAVL